MKVQRGALLRASAIALATLLAFAAVIARDLTSPTGAGYNFAMAAAPAGGLYFADESRRRLILIDGAGAHVLGQTPLGVYRALAADDGGHLLLGGESGLFFSADSGRSWRFVIPNRRFTTVAMGPDYWLAAAWNDALYRSTDEGGTWSKVAVPAGDTEFEQVTPGFAATLLGLLHSSDGGLTWQRLAGSGDRMTAVSTSGPGIAADWYGRVWFYDPVNQRLRGSPASCPGGIWSLAGRLVATTQGLCPRPRSGPALLADHEVTSVVNAGRRDYAAVARGAIYVSDDGDNWRFAYQPGG